MIQDITSARTPKYYLSLIYLAKKRNLPVMLYGNGIGPVTDPVNQFLTEKILNKADIITLREEASKLELDRLNISKPFISMTADPVISLNSVEKSDVSYIFEKEGIPLSKKYLGISVRNWKDNKKVIEVISRTCEKWCAANDYIPVFIPMQFPDDMEISKEIKEKLSVPSYVIKSRHGLSGDKFVSGVISKMDMLLGMRLHSLIFACLENIPCVGIIYDIKVQNFLEYMNIDDICSAGNIEGLSEEGLGRVLDRVLSQKEDVKEKYREYLPVLKERVQKNKEYAIKLLEGKSYE